MILNQRVSTATFIGPKAASHLNNPSIRRLPTPTFINTPFPSLPPLPMCEGVLFCFCFSCSLPRNLSPTSQQNDRHEQALVSNVILPKDIGVTYDMIGGLGGAKELLRQCITYPLRFPHLYNEGIAREAVKGVLLFGPPGKEVFRQMILLPRAVRICSCVCVVCPLIRSCVIRRLARKGEAMYARAGPDRHCPLHGGRLKLTIKTRKYLFLCLRS